ncbi:hypothetical protein [Pseudomonas sp. RA_35y_Pfl2_P32]|uniref:hypothetical protein n=1 Tax=Pseudomonas sp. RA_35y_Pfl2_P32 TaxID=3088705 RepID=UPI0030DDCCEC
MTSMEKVDAIKKVDAGRAAMSAVRQARSLSRTKRPILEGLLPDVAGDDNNKLLKARQGVDNNVVISEVLEIIPPPAPGRPLIIRLLWQNSPTGDPLSLVTPVGGSQTLVLPASATVAEGVFLLSYRLEYAGNIYNYDPPVPIFIDKEAPNKHLPGQPLVLPPEYADGRITKERLEANPVIVLTIPLHPDRRTGDICRVYMGASAPGTFINSYTTPDDSSSTMTVELTKAQVENGLEGNRILYYTWEDRVGNLGPDSNELDVIVELTPAPSNLKPLTVPEALAPEHLITLKDAFPDVGVVVEAYDNSAATDQIEVTWDGIAQDIKFAGAGFPLIFDVPYEHVKRNGLGPRPVTVTYLVRRRTSEYRETTVVPVNVDLRRAGTMPPDPEDPDVGNPNLSPVTVQAAKTPTPNQFELVDAGEDGTATTTIDAKRDVGDVYQLYWGGVPVPGANYEVVGGEADDFVVEMKVAHGFITAHGNDPDIPVHYTISNPGLPDDNENPSLRQSVSVYVVPVTLPAPKINHLKLIDGVGYLNCSSLRSISNVGWAAVVDVPGGDPLESGMVLAFTWSGITYDDGGVPLPVPDYTFTKPLTGNEHVDGFSVYIPHDAALLPIKDGDGKILYQTMVGGRIESSAAHEVPVVVRDAVGGNCPLP